MDSDWKIAAGLRFVHEYCHVELIISVVHFNLCLEFKSIIHHMFIQVDLKNGFKGINRGHNE